MGSFNQTAADRLADEVAVLVRRGVLDSRAPAADALLDYRDPPTTERSDRLAEADARIEELEADHERKVSEIECLELEIADLNTEVAALAGKEAKDVD